MNQAIRLYFGAGRGGGGGGWLWGGGGGAGGVVGICLLFNCHGSTEVIGTITAYVGPATKDTFDSYDS